VSFDAVDREPNGLQSVDIARNRLCVSNARNPREESAQLRRQCAIAREVAQTEASARHEPL
jgi:hypothetical protein